ncbi:MAG: PEGA domain-containing protein [Methanoregula sp.]|uniref:PEGA domain-containing protein n=1 Tax=Methanoregula sp. TaxID=2052170 RepID=UPI003C23825E
MVILPRTLTMCAAVLCATLVLVMPSAAINTAIYGDAAGFVPALHQDTFEVACALPGTAGVELDNNISCFTNTSMDVIFIGGDAGFTQETATALANATKAGRIMVVTGTDLPRFTDILPALTSGIAPPSLALLETDPNTTISENIFAGMPSRFPNTTLVSTREQYEARAGATTLMSFDNSDPALLFTPYGSGYVVAWLPPADQAYLSSTDTDLINERLIIYLLALRSSPAAAATETTVPATTTPVSVNTTVPAAATTAAASVVAPGNVSVYSSPLGANVFVDGVYEGITPVNLTGISAGSHALKLAMTGYYDYDTTISVVGAGTITAFGSLPPRESPTTAPTTVPVTTTTTDTSSVWSSPSVVAAVLGIITAIIGAIVTIFTIYHKHTHP